MNEDQPGYGMYYVVQVGTNIRSDRSGAVVVFDSVSAALELSESWSRITEYRWLPIMVNVYNERYRAFME